MYILPEDDAVRVLSLVGVMTLGLGLGNVTPAADHRIRTR